MHQTTPARQCFICFADLHTQSHLIYYFHSYPICTKCLQQFEVLDKYVDIRGVKVHVLYAYNEFFRKILYQYKGLDDLALKEVFFACYPELKKACQNKVIVAMASRSQDNVRRGYNPASKLALELSNTVFEGLYKRTDYKQTKQKDRSEIFKVLSIKDGHLLEGKDVIILDDVMTSSSSMQAAIALVEQYHPHSIEGLVLATPSIQQFQPYHDKNLLNDVYVKTQKYIKRQEKKSVE